MTLDTDIQSQAHSRSPSDSQFIAEENHALEQVVVEGSSMPMATDKAHHLVPEAKINQEQTTLERNSDDDAHGADHALRANMPKQTAHWHDANTPSVVEPIPDDSSHPPVDNGETDHSRSRRAFFGMNRTDRAYGTSNDDYEAKYAPDPWGEEAGPDARIWRVYLDEAEAYDREMLVQWGETIEVLLVFAGLFSAVVTTFVAQTSQSLQADYTQVSASLLTELVALQRAAAQSLSPIDVPASSLNISTSFTPGTSISIVNGLWFMSLTLSLSTALFCILVRQWIHSYSSTISGLPRERAFLRQLRIDGVDNWRLRDILGILPLLLHASLLLFFGGLVLFLIPLQLCVGAAIAAVVGLTAILYMASAILAVFYIQCPYRTPLSEYIRMATLLTSRWSWPARRAVINSIRFMMFKCSISEGYGKLERWSGWHVLRPLKSQELYIIHARESHYAARATNWLLRTTTRPSAESVVIQALAGFNRLSTLQVIRLGGINIHRLLNAWKQSVHAATSIVDHESEPVFRSKVYHFERLCRAMTRLASFENEPVYTLSTSGSSRGTLGEHLRQGISLLVRTRHFFPPGVASTRSALWAIQFAHLSKDLSDPALINMINEMDVQECHTLWPCIRPTLSLYLQHHQRLNTSHPLYSFYARLKVLLILCQHLHEVKFQEHAGLLVAVDAMKLAYCMICPNDVDIVIPYFSPVSSLDWFDRALDRPDVRWTDFLAHKELADKLSLIMLSILAGFKAQHPAWSSHKSARDAVVSCVVWLCWMIHMLYDRHRTCNLLDVVRVDGLDRGRRGTTVREMWAIDIVGTLEEIVAFDGPDATPLFESNKPSFDDNDYKAILGVSKSVLLLPVRRSSR